MANNLTGSKVAPFSIVVLRLFLQHNTVQIGPRLSGRLPPNPTQGLCSVLSAQCSHICKGLAVGMGPQTQADCGIRTAKEEYLKQKHHDHHYGPESQQDDVTPSELLQLCQEFYERELKVSNDKQSYIEQNTIHQSEYNTPIRRQFVTPTEKIETYSIQFKQSCKAPVHHTSW